MNDHALGYHWHTCQDGNGWADLDITLSGECGYCTVVLTLELSAPRRYFAPESSGSVGETVHVHLSTFPFHFPVWIAYSTRAHIVALFEFSVS